MAPPLMPTKHQFHSGAFTLMNASSEGFDQRLNVRKNNGWRCWLAEDSGQSFPMLGVHRGMLSLSASTCNQTALVCWLGNG